MRSMVEGARSLGVGGAMLSDGIVAARTPACHAPFMQVTIIGRPDGEAPDWVRDAWIGLRLPLSHPEKRIWRSTGVLTGPRGYLGGLLAMIRGRTDRVPGYLVDARAAIEILARTNPAAAAWWREHAQHLLGEGSDFVFEQEVCRPGED